MDWFALFTELRLEWPTVLHIIEVQKSASSSDTTSAQWNFVKGSMEIAWHFVVGSCSVV